MNRKRLPLKILEDGDEATGSKVVMHLIREGCDKAPSGARCGKGRVCLVHRITPFERNSELPLIRGEAPWRTPKLPVKQYLVVAQLVRGIWLASLPHIVGARDYHAANLTQPARL